MERNLDEAQFVLMVCTETYRRRIMGQEEPGKGLGVRWEGSLICNRIYHDKPSGSRFLPILLLPGSEPAHIPDPVRGHSYYRLATFDLTDPGYEALYRHLTDQPATPRPDLGPIQILPPIPRPQTVPGPLPPSGGPWWNVPYPRNPNFTGREAILEQLETALASGTPAALTQTIAGLGGVGKTQTAVEYAFRHRDQYRAVLWVLRRHRDQPRLRLPRPGRGAGPAREGRKRQQQGSRGRPPLAGPRAGLPADPRQRRRPRPGQAVPTPPPPRATSC